MARWHHIALGVSLLAITGSAEAAPKDRDVVIVNGADQPVPVGGRVEVTNGFSNPVPVEDAFDREPFSDTFIDTTVTGGTLDSFIALPEGRILVIEQVSARIDTGPGGQLETLFFLAGSGSFQIPVTEMGEGTGRFVALQQVRIYAERSLRLLVDSGSDRLDTVLFSYSGYLIDRQSPRLAP